MIDAHECRVLLLGVVVDEAREIGIHGCLLIGVIDKAVGRVGLVPERPSVEEALAGVGGDKLVAVGAGSRRGRGEEEKCSGQRCVESVGVEHLAVMLAVVCVCSLRFSKTSQENPQSCVCS